MGALMNKTALFLFCILVLAFIAEADNLGVGINFGILSDGSLRFQPLYLSGGIGIDFHLTRYFMVTTEATLYTDTGFADFWIYPAALLNLKAGSIFAGAGVGKFIELAGNHSRSTEFSLKVNGGLRSGSLRITLYIITPFENTFSANTYGAGLGFEF